MCTGATVCAGRTVPFDYWWVTAHQYGGTGLSAKPHATALIQAENGRCSSSGPTDGNGHLETFVRSRIGLQHGRSTLSRTVLNACSSMTVCHVPETWRLPDCLHHLSWKTLRTVPRRRRLNEHGYCQNVYLPRKCRNYKNLNWPKEKKKKRKKLGKTRQKKFWNVKAYFFYKKMQYHWCVLFLFSHYVWK